jgi:hypothetical protein
MCGMSTSRMRPPASFMAIVCMAPTRRKRATASMRTMIDPYSKRLAGQFVWNDAHFGYRTGHKQADLSFDRRDNARFMLKSVVVDPAHTWSRERRTPTAWEDTIIYEAHVKGLTQQRKAANELGEALTADEIARVKHCRADSEAKAGCPRNPGVLPGENQVVGKEVNKAMQESAEGPLRGPSATETARDASVHRDLDRVVCARHLIHDWQCS